MDFTISLNHWVKRKVCENIDKDLTLPEYLEKLLNMWLRVVATLFGAHETVHKGLKENWSNRKPEEEKRLSTPQHF